MKGTQSVGFGEMVDKSEMGLRLVEGHRRVLLKAFAWDDWLPDGRGDSTEDPLELRLAPKKAFWRLALESDSDLALVSDSELALVSDSELALVSDLGWALSTAILSPVPRSDV